MQMQKRLITRSLSSKRRFREPLWEERKAISRDGEAARDTKVKGRTKRTRQEEREVQKGNDQIVKRRGAAANANGKLKWMGQKQVFRRQLGKIRMGWGRSCD